MWYGKRGDLAQCLIPHAQVWAELSVTGGQWTWTGNAPSAQPGDQPTLVAVDDSGLYFLQRVPVLNNQGVNQPYRLAAAPVGVAPPVPDVPAYEAVLGEPISLTGSGLPIPDGSVRIGLGFHGWNGTDDPDLGMAQIKGGRLDATVTVPPLVTADGGPSAMLVPGDYFLELTPTERPFTFVYTLSVRLLPNPEDKATLAAFWRRLASDGRITQPLNAFPHLGAVEACYLHASADRPDATCQTQISRVDPRHDPVASGPREALRTVTLTASWSGNNHIWSFVVDREGRIITSNETGAPLPDR